MFLKNSDKLELLSVLFDVPITDEISSCRAICNKDVVPFRRRNFWINIEISISSFTFVFGAVSAIIALQCR